MLNWKVVHKQAESFEFKSRNLFRQSVTLQLFAATHLLLAGLRRSFQRPRRPLAKVQMFNTPILPRILC